MLAGHPEGAPLRRQAQSPCGPADVQGPTRLLEVGEARSLQRGWQPRDAALLTLSCGSQNMFLLSRGTAW